MDMIKWLLEKLKGMYGEMSEWWPGETPFHIAIGAILTQNTTWTSAYKSLQNLIQAGLDTPEALYEADINTLMELIRPSGFMRQKAYYLKNLAEFVCRDLKCQLENLRNTDNPREKLLGVKGIGKETADSILLYGLHLPYFVVDAYTKRLLCRLGIIDRKTSYDDIAKLFMDNLPRNVKLYQEYHALIVEHAKRRCRKKNPLCHSCLLKDQCLVGKKEDQDTQDV